MCPYRKFSIRVCIFTCAVSVNGFRWQLCDLGRLQSQLPGIHCITSLIGRTVVLAELEMWQLCADHLKTSLYEVGLSGGRCRLVCMWLAGICRKPGNLSLTLQHALHPISALRAPSAGLSHLLGSYGVCPDISCLSCLHLSSQLLVQQSTQSRATGRIRTSLPDPDCLAATRVPLVFISFSFFPCL